MRVYPEEGSTLYVRVLLHKTRRGMRSFVKQGHGDDLGPLAEGCCFQLTGHAPRLVAEVHLNEEHLDGDTIAHELMHATLAWGRHVNLPWLDLGAPTEWVAAAEERMAWVNGNMTGQVYNRLLEWGYGE